MIGKKYINLNNSPACIIPMDEDHKGDRLSAIIDLVSSFPVKDRLLLISKVAKNLHHEHNIPIQEIIESIKEKPSDLELPVSIFTSHLSCLQAIVKHLHEDKQLSFSKIAEILNRSPKTIWTTYQKAAKKYPKRLDASNFHYSIPLAIFKDRNFSVLELVVFYLRDAYDLSYHNIGSLIQRSYKTVWTVYTRARRKIKI